MATMLVEGCINKRKEINPQIAKNGTNPPQKLFSFFTAAQPSGYVNIKNILKIPMAENKANI